MPLSARSRRYSSMSIRSHSTHSHGLPRGRTGARETEPIGPVEDAVVEATLPHLSRRVRGLVEFQRLTGCRPGEACTVRRCDPDTGGAIWQ